MAYLKTKCFQIIQSKNVHFFAPKISSNFNYYQIIRSENYHFEKKLCHIILFKNCYIFKTLLSNYSVRNWYIFAVLNSVLILIIIISFGPRSCILFNFYQIIRSFKNWYLKKKYYYQIPLYCPAVHEDDGG